MRGSKAIIFLLVLGLILTFLVLNLEKISFVEETTKDFTNSSRIRLETLFEVPIGDNDIYGGIEDVEGKILIFVGDTYYLDGEIVQDSSTEIFKSDSYKEYNSKLLAQQNSLKENFESKKSLSDYGNKSITFTSDLGDSFYYTAWIDSKRYLIINNHPPVKLREGYETVRDAVEVDESVYIEYWTPSESMYYDNSFYNLTLDGEPFLEWYYGSDGLLDFNGTLGFAVSNSKSPFIFFAGEKIEGFDEIIDFTRVNQEPYALVREGDMLKLIKIIGK